MTLLDITGVARAFYAMTYSPFIPFLMAAALYLLCTFLLIFTFARRAALAGVYPSRLIRSA